MTTPTVDIRVKWWFKNLFSIFSFYYDKLGETSKCGKTLNSQFITHSEAIRHETELTVTPKRYVVFRIESASVSVLPEYCFDWFITPETCLANAISVSWLTRRRPEERQDFSSNIALNRKYLKSLIKSWKLSEQLETKGWSKAFKLRRSDVFGIQRSVQNWN